MNTDKHEWIELDGVLFDRVVSILEQARGHVVRAVNSNMVLAYWLIGREIVQEVQGGEERAEYWKQVVEDLSSRLIQKYKKGFFVTNLQDFRKFCRAYLERFVIQHPAGGEFSEGFNPQLSWSHYRALMRVKDEKERRLMEVSLPEKIADE